MASPQHSAWTRSGSMTASQNQLVRQTSGHGNSMRRMVSPEADGIIMLGSLWKEKGNWMSKIGTVTPITNLRYNLRFFALVDSKPTRLCAWKEESSFRAGEDAEHTIALDGCSLSCAEQHTGNANSFGIFHPERSEVYLMCPDSEQYAKWMQALEGVLINPQKLRLKDFDFMTMVGRGSFGQVFQVRKKDTNRVYALKVLEKSYVKKQAQVENTKSERRVLEVVNHPFIVSLHYAFQTGKALCLVMDFINGGELFMHLKQQRYFCEDDARIWAAEILLALEYLHSMDIIYRDIKPENVLLDREGHIKITDFGLARDRTETVQSSTVAGSPYYMAPEVLLMQGHDVQADWWSLGILVYEMLVGLPPFYCDNAKEAYQRLLSSPLEFPDHVSSDARELIRGLLMANPAQRLGARHRQRRQSKLLAEGWGDGMAIKAQAWFKGTKWDQILLKRVAPSFKPKLKDDNDVSYFDDSFTGDRSWRRSNLLRHTSFEELPADEFGADFNYVMRPTASPMHATSNTRPSLTLDDLSADRSPLKARTDSDVARQYAALSGDSYETLPPWQPRRKSTDGVASGGEGDGAGCSPNASMLSFVGHEESREYLSMPPYAKAGYLESTKKGSFGTYVTPKRRFVRLVPSLGCLLLFKDEECTSPIKVLPLPPAAGVYPKQGIIHLGRRVCTHSLRILRDERPVTLICEDQPECDAWVAALRTVGERWRFSDQPGLQLVEAVKSSRSKSLLHAVFGKASDRETWQAVQRDGATVEMMSEKGLDREGVFRYDGEQCQELRHGRGLCSWQDCEHYYDGHWTNGRGQGQAIALVRAEGLYEGGWDAVGGRQGYGRMVEENGSYYEGWWLADRRHGYGYQWWAESNEAHRGLFERGEPHGHGTRHYPTGAVYTGGWLNGRKHGVGVVEEAAEEEAGGGGRAGGEGMKRVRSRRCIDGDAVELHMPHASPHSSVESGSPKARTWDAPSPTWDASAPAASGALSVSWGATPPSPLQSRAFPTKSEPVTPVAGPGARAVGEALSVSKLSVRVPADADDWGRFGRGQLGSFQRGPDDSGPPPMELPVSAVTVNSPGPITRARSSPGPAAASAARKDSDHHDVAAAVAVPSSALAVPPPSSLGLSVSRGGSDSSDIIALGPITPLASPCGSGSPRE